MSQLERKSRVVRQLRHGQITIPKAFRDALGIDPEDLLRLTLAEGKLELAPVKSTANDPTWVKRLYDQFAPVRDSLERSIPSAIDEAIDEAVKQSRAERRRS